MLLTDRGLVRSALTPAYNKEGENGGDEEEDAVRMLLNCAIPTWGSTWGMTYSWRTTNPTTSLTNPPLRSSNVDPMGYGGI